LFEVNVVRACLVYSDPCSARHSMEWTEAHTKLLALRAAQPKDVFCFLIFRKSRDFHEAVRCLGTQLNSLVSGWRK